MSWWARELNRLTLKRKKRVFLPIPQELFVVLEAERDRRTPQPDERILVNPCTGEPMTRPRLHRRMVAMGKRAGVPDADPHRYRDTLAVDLLVRGATPYDVAKLLGDTVETIEKHYAPFVPGAAGTGAPLDRDRPRTRANRSHDNYTVARKTWEGTMKTTENKIHSWGRVCLGYSVSYAWPHFANRCL